MLGTECTNCHGSFEFTTGNLVVHYFEAQPFMSFGLFKCPVCHNESRLFMRDNYQELLEFFITHDYGFITEEFAPEDVVAAFEEMYHVKELPEHALTTRLDSEVKALGEVLSNIPDDLLWAEITSPELPHEKPERWI